MAVGKIIFRDYLIQTPTNPTVCVTLRTFEVLLQLALLCQLLSKRSHQLLILQRLPAMFWVDDARGSYVIQVSFENLHHD